VGAGDGEFGDDPARTLAGVVPDDVRPGAAAICGSSASRPTSGQVLATARTTQVTHDTLGPAQ
jgi:hypothetical protein